MGNERTVHCPKCGHALKRISADVEYYKGFGITMYDAHCDKCGTTVEVEDRSSFEQKGKIKIIFN
jgi:endogenous inhibitor of DNA gyrase (YacG/DUF329 family)